MRAQIRVPKQLNLRTIMPLPQEFYGFDVIDAAIIYFGANNLRNASVHILALHAGVSCASHYNAFGDKPSSFRSSLAQTVARSFRHAIEAELTELTPLRKIERFFVQHLTRAFIRRKVTRGGHSVPVSAKKSSIQTVLHSSRGQSRGSKSTRQVHLCGPTAGRKYLHSTRDGPREPPPRNVAQHEHPLPLKA
jgi:hypothetical protein